MLKAGLRSRGASSLAMAHKNRDEDLALFHDLHQLERQRPAPQLPAYYGAQPLQDPFSSSACRPRPSTPPRVRGANDLLASDSNKSDYDWLLTPPGTPLVSSLDQEAPAAGLNHQVRPLVRSLAALNTSRLANLKTEPFSTSVRGDLGLWQPNPCVSLSSTTCAANRRSSPTPTLNTASRQSTNPGRPTVPATRSTSLSRSSTPRRRPSTPNFHQSNFSGVTGRSSSVGKASSLASRTTPSSQGSSPITRPIAWEASAIPDFLLEAPPNLRTTLHEHSICSSRGGSARSRSGGRTVTRTVQAEEPDASTRSRQKSCSPSMTRGRLITDIQSSDCFVSQNDKLSNSAAELSVPIVIASKMVERVMQARRAAAIVQDDQSAIAPISQAKRPVKSSPTTQKSSGLGRNSSKKSLDMARQHMDISRSTPGGFRPLMPNIPPSSLYSVRSGSRRNRATAVTSSPRTTSSSSSSEHSMRIMPDSEGSENCDEVSSERASRTSPINVPESGFSFSKERRVTNWVSSPDYRDDSVDLMQLFRQVIERFSGSESPLVCQHGGFSDCDQCGA